MDSVFSEYEGCMHTVKKLINEHCALFTKERPLSASNEWVWEKMHGDGSSREFFRLSTNQFSLIVVVSVPADLMATNENDSYYYIGNHLREKGLPVPEIFIYDREAGVLVLEDLGDSHLQTLIDFEKNREESIKWYTRVIGILVKMQVDGAANFDTSKCFDTPIYDATFIFERELEYFRKEFLNNLLHKNVNRDVLSHDFYDLARSVASIPSNYFMHRDFQSRNLMVNQHGWTKRSPASRNDENMGRAFAKCKERVYTIKGNKFFIIDFQGGRLGPPTYDLASLLIDPYVDMPHQLQESFLRMYFYEAKRFLRYSFEEFYDAFWKTALCRNLQVLAAFAFLSTKKKKLFFKKYIQPAVKQLSFVLEHIPIRDYPLLRSYLHYSLLPGKLRCDAWEAVRE